jgi:hypothetical protein
VADGWCWFVVREEYCWLVAGGWFVLREKYCWLVADKPSEILTLHRFIIPSPSAPKTQNQFGVGSLQATARAHPERPTWGTCFSFFHFPF